MMQASFPMSASPRSRGGEGESRLIFAVCFAIFLPVALLARAVPGWRPGPLGPAGARSVVGEARAAAAMIVPFAFMG